MRELPFNIIFAEPQPITEEEIDITRMAREGQTLNLPPHVFNFFRDQFESSTKFPLLSKTMNALGNASLAFVPPTLVSVFAQGSTPPSFLMTIGLISGVWSTTMVTLSGRRALSESNFRLNISKERYSARVKNHMEFLEGRSTHAAKSYFADVLDSSVRAGKHISMEDLAKLVHFDNGFLRHACDKLAITVLQAKMMIAQQDKKVVGFAIANSTDAGWAKGTHEDFLALKLWDQYRKQTLIAETPPDQYAFSPDTPYSRTNLQQEQPQQNMPTTSVGALVRDFVRATSQYFINGIKAHAVVYRKPKASDHLPAIPTELTVPAFATTPDLADRIKRYGMEHLDLPALAQK